MPATWPAAALEAQAIAARSYALAQLAAVVTASPFDLYDDWRSQVYGGIAAETPAIDQAVAATAGEVVLYHGKVATTYFSSSSGGETVSAAEGTGTPVPYLVSVPDPYDTLSPDHDWGPVLVSAADAGKALGLGGPSPRPRDAVRASGHVASVTAVGAGGQVTLTGLQVAERPRPALDLVPGRLPRADARARRPSCAGTAVTLTGTVEGLGGVALEAEAKGGPWRTVAPVVPDSAGAFSVAVTPRGHDPLPARDRQRPGRADQGRGGHALSRARARHAVTYRVRAPVKKHLVLAALAGLLVPAGALAFTNTEPDAAQQWYLGEDNAWTHWPTEPRARAGEGRGDRLRHRCRPPRVRGRIAGGVSFVGGSWRVDTCGHGTFVAGEIAANPSNGVGIAGIAFNAKLLIAKVVDDRLRRLDRAARSRRSAGRRTRAPA